MSSATLLIIQLLKDGVSTSIITDEGEIASQHFQSVSFIKQNHELRLDPYDLMFLLRRSLAAISKKAAKEFERVSSVSVITECFASLAWDSVTGEVLSPLISHESECVKAYELKLLKNQLGEYIRNHCGASLYPESAACTFYYLKERYVSQIKESTVFGSVESWVLAQLTGQKRGVLDYASASKTLLFSLDLLEWDPFLLGEYGLTQENLPKIYPSSALLGKVDGFLPIKDGTPVVSCVTVSQSQLIGAQALSFGECFARLNFFDGQFMFNCGTDVEVFKTWPVTVVPSSSEFEGSYELEVPIQLPSFPQALYQPETFERFLGDSLGEYEGRNVVMVSENKQLSWVINKTTGSTITGLSSQTTEYEMIKAYFHSLVYHMKEFINEFEEKSSMTLKEIRVGGDITSFDSVLQYMADITQKQIVKVRSSNEEELGALILSASQDRNLRGIYSHLGLLYRQFIPMLDPSLARRAYDAWHDISVKVR